MGKHLHKRKAKKNIPIRVAAVLVYLVLVTNYFVTGTFARYSTSETGGDSARVAKFSVRGDGILQQPIEANLAPGEKAKNTTLNIYNDSEVAVEYTVTVTNETKNLPLNFYIATGESNVEPNSNGSIVIKNQPLPCGKNDQYNLIIGWKEGESNPAVMGMVDHIVVTVTAVQVD